MPWLLHDGLLLGLALVAGAALRFAQLTAVPPGLNQDEAVNGYDAFSLWLTGRDHHGHLLPLLGLESFGDWVSPLLTFLTAPAVGLFGLRVAVLRAVAATLGLLAIPLVYLLARELFRRRSVALGAAWLLALSPFAVHLSRWAIPPAIVPAMVTLTAWLFLRAINRGSGVWLLGAALAAGLTVAGYPTMKLYVPLLGLAGVVIYSRELRRIGWRGLVAAAWAFAIIAGPIVIFSTFNPAGRARFDQISVFHAYRGAVIPAMVIVHYLAYLSPRYLFFSGDGDAMHVPRGFGLELPITLPLVVVGLVWLVARAARPAAPDQRRAPLFLLAAVICYPVPGALTVPSPNALRGAQEVPLVALLAALGAVALIDAARRSAARLGGEWPRALPAALLALLLVLLGQEAFGWYRNYVERYPATVEVEFQDGLEPAVEYALAHQSDYVAVWFTGINQPYIYVLFEARWPPADAQRQLQVRRDPPDFNQVDSIGEFHFGDAPPLDQAEPIDTIRESSGRALYVLRSGVVPGEGRVLLFEPA